MTNIIFSNRSNMSYEEIKDYLKRLQRLPDVQIDWTGVNPDRIQSVEHSKMAGLQAADAVASSVHYAVKLNMYKETEPAYLQHLKRTIYRHKSEYLGYGVKVWPGSLGELKTKAPEAENLEGL